MTITRRSAADGNQYPHVTSGYSRIVAGALLYYAWAIWSITERMWRVGVHAASHCRDLSERVRIFV